MKYYEIPGWFNGHEQYDKAVDYCPQNGNILEIGCFYGRSTHYMCSNILNTNRKDITVYCLDTFKGSSEHANLKELLGEDGTFYEFTKKNLQPFIDEGFLHLLQSRSDNPEIINSFEDKFFDTIIVDGAHEYDAVLDDIENWWSKLKDTGVMLFDDMYMESVNQATHKGLANKVSEFSVVYGKETYGIACKSDDKKQMEKLIKITPENYFK
tara:strand:- start:30 stop:662 length:633 start_codon:yes stop_codon:yes gene_type:complete